MIVTRAVLRRMQSESAVRVSGRTELLMWLLFLFPFLAPAGVVIADGGAAAVLLTRRMEERQMRAVFHQAPRYTATYPP